MSREVCPRILHRCANAFVGGTVALTLAAAPSLAHAAQPRLLDASMATGMTPTGARLRTIMSLQEPGDELADPAADAPAADAPAAPVAEGPPPAPAPAPGPVGPEPSKGLGLMITGAIMTPIGLFTTFWGIWGVIQYNKAQKATDDGLVQAAAGLGKGASIGVAVFGLMILGAGAPMLGVGAYKFSKYQKWKRGEQVFVPAMNRTAHGTWTGGLAMRF